jgi:pyruvate/2-oxoglutarate dehydrogenase complex dihydrolipoamide dehydrogenase (E3) component
MSTVERYDILVLGSGTGSKLLSWTMAKEGKRTAVVERKLIGGSCPNVACLPSKNVIHTAKVVSLVKRHQEFGIRIGPIEVDVAGVYARKRKMVDDPVEVHLNQYHASETRGFMKAIIHANSDRILGFAALGPEAGELLGAVQIVMMAGQPYTMLRDAVFTHPTMNEGLKPLFAGVPQRSVTGSEKLESAHIRA